MRDDDNSGFVSSTDDSYFDGRSRDRGFAEERYTDDGHPDAQFGEPPTVAEMAKSRDATIGLVCGLVSVVGWLLPILGLQLTIFGIVKSGNGLGSLNGGRAVAGLVLSIIFLLLTIANAAVGAYMAATGQHPFVN